MEPGILAPLGLAVGALLGGIALSNEVERQKRENEEKSRVPIPVENDDPRVQQRKSK